MWRPVFVILVIFVLCAAAGPAGISSIFPTVASFAASSVTVQLSYVGNVSSVRVSGEIVSFTSACEPVDGNCTLNLTLHSVSVEGFQNISVAASGETVFLTHSRAVYRTSTCAIQNMYVSAIGECLPCPEHATCPGGAQVWPAAGYWNNASALGAIVGCEPAARCLGGANSPCLSGHSGAYCASCDPVLYPFPQFDSGLCSLCATSDYNFVYGYIVFLVLLECALLLFSDVNLIHVEFLLDTIPLLHQLNVIARPASVAGEVNSYIQMFQLNGIDASYLSLSCFLGPSMLRFDYLYLANGVLVSVIFISVQLTMILNLWIRSWWQTRQGHPDRAAGIKEHYRQRMMRLFMSQVSFSYSMMTDMTFYALNCQLIGDGTYTLNVDMQVHCFSGGHIAIFILAIISLAFLIGYPTFILYMAYRFTKSSAAEEGILRAATEAANVGDTSQLNEKKVSAALFWGITPLLLAIEASIASAILGDYPFARLALHTLFLLPYFVAFVITRPFSERWKNFTHGFPAFIAVLAIIHGYFWYGAGWQNADIAWALDVLVMICSSLVLGGTILTVLLTMLPKTSFSLRILALMNGPKKPGSIGPSEMAATITRVRAKVRARQLPEGARQVFEEMYVWQAGGPTAALAGPAVGVEEYTPDVMVFPATHEEAKKIAAAAVAEAEKLTKELLLKLAESQKLRAEAEAIARKDALAEKAKRVRKKKRRVAPALPPIRSLAYEEKPHMFTRMHSKGIRFKDVYNIPDEFADVMKDVLAIRRAMPRLGPLTPSLVITPPTQQTGLHSGSNYREVIENVRRELLGKKGARVHKLEQRARAAGIQGLNKDDDSLDYSVDDVLTALITLFGEEVLQYVPKANDPFWEQQDDPLESLFYLFEAAENDMLGDAAPSGKDDGGSDSDRKHARMMRKAMKRISAKAPSGLKSLDNASAAAVKEYGRIKSREAPKRPEFKEFNLSYKTRAQRRNALLGNTLMDEESIRNSLGSHSSTEDPPTHSSYDVSYENGTRGSLGSGRPLTRQSEGGPGTLTPPKDTRRSRSAQGRRSRSVQPLSRAQQLELDNQRLLAKREEELKRSRVRDGEHLITVKPFNLSSSNRRRELDTAAPLTPTPADRRATLTERRATLTERERRSTLGERRNVVSERRSITSDRGSRSDDQERASAAALRSDSLATDAVGIPRSRTTSFQFREFTLHTGRERGAREDSVVLPSITRIRRRPDSVVSAVADVSSRRSIRDATLTPVRAAPVLEPIEANPEFLTYKPLATDPVDNLVANYIHGAQLPPRFVFRRIAKGQYVFGTRRLKLGELLGDLIVPMGGGGFVEFVEWLTKHKPTELLRLERQLEKERTER
eukprot:TRINITY_DN3551_c0_g1_i1.p1 TRINITY_DN3551_c0_g1~~TRINITY_DN3551_c0_g1_i1.p1  ORF type:complete len:1349 (+),score=275.21 TRINITY_DN3551_c0_g1_i1:855-4901(+)